MTHTTRNVIPNAHQSILRNNGGNGLDGGVPTGAETVAVEDFGPFDTFAADDGAGDF
jgi:hypothetical protein